MPFYFAAPEAVCYSSRPSPDRTRLNLAEIVPRAPIPTRGPPRGARTVKLEKTAPILPIFRHSSRGAATPHPDAPARLVPSDETESQSEAPIISYGRNRQNLKKRPILLCGPRGRVQ